MANVTRAYVYIKAEEFYAGSTLDFFCVVFFGITLYTSKAVAIDELRKNTL